MQCAFTLVLFCTMLLHPSVLALEGECLASQGCIVEFNDADFYVDVKNVVESQSLQIIKAVPISHYFDVIRGEYRTGILGEQAEQIFPNTSLAQRVEKKITNNKDEVVTVEIPVVDSSQVFTHLVSAIKVAAQMHDVLASNVAGFTGLQASKVENFRHILNDKEWQTAAELKGQERLIELRTERISYLIMRETEKYKNKHANQKFRLETRKQLRQERQRKLVLAIEESSRNITRVNNEKLKYLDELHREDDGLQFEHDLKELEMEHTAEINRMSMEIQGIIDSAVFRIDEEARMEREQEEHYLKIIKAKDESRSKVIAEVIKAVFDQIATQFHVLGDPLRVLAWARNGLLFAFTFILLYEVVTGVGVMWKRWRRPPRVRYERAGGNMQHRSENSLKGEGLVLPPPTLEAIQCIGRSLAAAAQHGAPLPNVLFVGPAGTGKTMGAREVAEASGLPFAVVSGADLEAHGALASAHLSALLRAPRAPAILVIDEPDDIVASRGRAVASEPLDAPQDDHVLDDTISGVDGAAEREAQQPQVTGTGAGASSTACFFVLLQALRMNQHRLAVVMTTSRPMSQIDSALLDRMDSVVALQLPSREMRLELSLRLFRAMLFPFVEAAMRTALEEKVYAHIADAVALAHALLLGPDANSVGAADGPTAGKSKGGESSAKRRGRIVAGAGDKRVDASPSPERDVPVGATGTGGTASVSVGAASAPLLGDALDGAEIDQAQPVGSVEDGSSARSVTGGNGDGDADADAGSDDPLDMDSFKGCIATLVKVSAKWSCRETHKFISSIESEVLASDRCLVTSSIWFREIRRSYDDIRKVTSEKGFT